ncbi:hypothetical protein GWK47_000845 [Chionoecetes opilio]|uniref:Uncharacterized protein n=1 Tax=Chionoecetes opilio TaxID=41210 RepID=A0A8J5C8D1_CHIOP|nr:hypothetical protein GWK47_000845 [Chionoecetes opilio]
MGVEPTNQQTSSSDDGHCTRTRNTPENDSLQLLSTLMTSTATHSTSRPTLLLTPALEQFPSPPCSCPVDDTEWSECADVLLDLLIEDYDAVAVYCYTIPPRGHRKSPTNIAKVTFKRQDLPDSIYVAGVHYSVNLTALLHASASPAAVLATLPSTADPLPAAHFVLNLAMLVPRVL